MMSESQASSAYRRPEREATGSSRWRGRECIRYLVVGWRVQSGAAKHDVARRCARPRHQIRAALEFRL